MHRIGRKVTIFDRIFRYKSIYSILFKDSLRPNPERTRNIVTPIPPKGVKIFVPKCPAKC